MGGPEIGIRPTVVTDRRRRQRRSDGRPRVGGTDITRPGRQRRSACPRIPAIDRIIHDLRLGSGTRSTSSPSAAKVESFRRTHDDRLASRRIQPQTRINEPADPLPVIRPVSMPDQRKTNGTRRLPVRILVISRRRINHRRRAKINIRSIPIPPPSRMLNSLSPPLLGSLKIARARRPRDRYAETKAQPTNDGTAPVIKPANH